MRVWLPAVRAGSGSDVYVRRLAAGLREFGIDAREQWFDARWELFPQGLRWAEMPAGTDIVHAGSWQGFAFARPGVPLVVTAFHNVYRSGYPQWKSLAQKMYHDEFAGRWERRTFARADALVTMAESAAQEFRERFELPPMQVIPGWVDTWRFSPGPARPVDPALAGRTRVLIVANRSRRKGFDLLPRFARALGRRFHITVVAGLRAGQQSGMAEVDRWASGLSEVELVQTYRDSDIVVSLARHEGFGYTVLEAMACARPVVAFDVTGIRDLVSRGRSGLLAPVEDVEALAACCAELADQPERAKAMALEGRRLSIEAFSREASLARYVDLYRDLSRRRPPRGPGTGP